MLKAAGKVIQTGIVIKGRMNMYLLKFLMVGFKFVVEVDMMFINVTEAPMTGRIPMGSGEDKSLNHKNPPSVMIPG